MNNLPLFIALRYLFSKKNSIFTSVITKSSIIGIALGITVVITVLSVMNGFHNELRNKILGMVSHVIISNVSGEVSDWENVVEKIKKHKHVVGYAPYIDGQGMITHKGEVRGVQVKGINPKLESSVTSLHQHIVDGDLNEISIPKFGVSIGKSLAKKLNVGLGDKITVIIPQAQTTALGVIPKIKMLKVSSIFHYDMSQYDNNYVFININDARKLFLSKKQVSGIRLKLDDLFNAPLVRDNLSHMLSNNLYALDWTMINKTFFDAIKLEKTMLLILMMLIVLVATFNILSSLFMVVSERKEDIAILKTLGLYSSDVTKIFIYQGMLLSLVGVFFGVIFGLIISYNLDVIISIIEYIIGRSLISSQIYFISDIPAEPALYDIVIVIILSLSMSFLATIYPSKKAAKYEPAQILKGN